MAEKKCRKCLVVKPLDEFVKRADRKSGYGSRCKECHYSARRDMVRPEPSVDFAPRACSTCNQVKDADGFILSPGCRDGYSLQCKRCMHLKHKYGITDAEYQQMLADCSGLCMICEEVMDNPHVDHDHATGKVRGLLCATCNRGIGQFKDSPKLLLAAVDYLERI